MTPDSADFSFLSLTVVPRLSQGVSERGGVCWEAGVRGEDCKQSPRKSQVLGCQQW